MKLFVIFGKSGIALVKGSNEPRLESGEMLIATLEPSEWPTDAEFAVWEQYGSTSFMVTILNRFQNAVFERSVGSLVCADGDPLDLGSDDSEWPAAEDRPLRR